MATKQNNFYLQYQQAAKAGKTSARNAFLRKAAPGIIIVAGCLLAWGGVVVHTALMRGQASDLRAPLRITHDVALWSRREPRSVGGLIGS